MILTPAQRAEPSPRTERQNRLRPILPIRVLQLKSGLQHFPISRLQIGQNGLVLLAFCFTGKALLDVSESLLQSFQLLL